MKAESYLPLVSVILTSYNHERYLSKAIESLVNQSYENIEIIIIDDASTDGSQDILLKYNNIKKVKTYINKINSGSYVNSTNYGATKANGDFLLFAQCDDYSEPNQIEKLLNSALENRSCQIVYSMSKMIDTHGKIINNDYEIRERFFKKHVTKSTKITGSMMLRLLSYSCVIPNLSAVLMTKTLYTELGGFSNDYIVVADWDFYLRASKITDFYYIKEPLNNFRQHGETIRSKTNLKIQILQLYQMFNTFIGKSKLTSIEIYNLKKGLGSIHFYYIIRNFYAWLSSLFQMCKELNKIDVMWFKYVLYGTVYNIIEKIYNIFEHDFKNRIL